MAKDPTTTTTHTDSVFLTHSGSTMAVKDAVSQNDCWFIQKERRWVLTHKAIQKIATLAGISKNYDVEESATVQPSYRNELEHIVRVTIKCNSKRKGKGAAKGCVHDQFENTLTKTGEANKVNTAVKGRGYLRTMAEKRAYDVAVLEHVGLYDTTFSEEESESMMGGSPEEHRSIVLTNVQLEAVKTEVNAIVSCTTDDQLAKAAAEVKIKKESKMYSDSQVKFLDKLINDTQLGFINEAPPQVKPF